MSVLDNLLMRMFGRPQGILGRLGGLIMARTNREFVYEVIDLLDIQLNDQVLEVGFGPGVGIQRLASLAAAGHIVGVDPSAEMVAQATALNMTAIEAGLVNLRQGSAESLPFADHTFDKAVAMNSMQVWPDAVGGLRDMRRVLKVGGRVAFGFTPYARQPRTGLTELLTTAGFTEAHLVEKNHGFCALANTA